MTPLKILLLIIVLQAFTVTAKSQSLQLLKDSSAIHITGTSNLHNWKMEVKDFDCTASFDLNGLHITGIEKAAFECKTTGLQSYNSMMDKKAYSALKAKTSPEIRFTLSQPVSIDVNKSGFSTKINGSLEIAGKANPVQIPVSGIIANTNGSLRIGIKGTTTVDMKSYDITAPTFMMGALKTGDNVTVSFEFMFVGS